MKTAKRKKKCIFLLYTPYKKVMIKYLVSVAAELPLLCYHMYRVTASILIGNYKLQGPEKKSMALTIVPSWRRICKKKIAMCECVIEFEAFPASITTRDIVWQSCSGRHVKFPQEKLCELNWLRVNVSASKTCGWFTSMFYCRNVV
jgi:hypothetical protein